MCYDSVRGVLIGGLWWCMEWVDRCVMMVYGVG